MPPVGLPGSVVIFVLLFFFFFEQLVIHGEVGLVGQAAFLVGWSLLQVFVHVRLGKNIF
jgi:hypothetical protein